MSALVGRATELCTLEAGVQREDRAIEKERRNTLSGHINELRDSINANHSAGRTDHQSER
jgi:hypothetical protein